MVPTKYLMYIDTDNLFFFYLLVYLVISALSPVDSNMDGSVRQVSDSLHALRKERYLPHHRTRHEL